MRLFTFLFLSLFIVSCASKKADEKQEEKKTEQAVEQNKPVQDGVQTDGAYREFYANGKVKIEGFLDQKGEKKKKMVFGKDSVKKAGSNPKYSF
jgi:hypothetical protein